ncbi:MAG: LacI family transcriptional regulator [Chloroflexi bacterium]|nr:LacI family transcriptional regulator [Chloroflexota bacterium]
MGRSSKSITIQDVARAAGVSVSTVSRVLNNKDDVALDTSQKVRSVIAELGYASSLAAKSLRSRQTGVIGLIIPDLEDPFCIQVVKGIHQAIVAFNYDLLAFTSGSIKQHSRAERERRYVTLLNGSLTDGIVVVTPAAISFSTVAPLAAIDPNDHCPDYLTVIATNRAGARAAMEYLLGLGHRRIGFIGGRPDLLCARQRLQGYEDALRQSNVTPDPALITIGNFTRAAGRSCAQQLLALPEPPTAIFAANDQSAFGAIEAAREAGLHVPDDLSIVGFDNVPEAVYFNPPLTTVDQFVVKMGYVATEMLIRAIQEGSSESISYEMPTQLVIRESCRATVGKSWNRNRA